MRAADLPVKTRLGLLRPYLIELGVTEDAELRPVEVACMLMVEHVEAMFDAEVATRNVLRIFEWLRPVLHVAEINEDRNTVVTIIDGTYVVSNAHPSGSVLDLSTGKRMSVIDFASRPLPIESTAISLTSLWYRFVRKQTESPDSAACPAAVH